MAASIRHLIIMLGDQLDRDSSAFDGFDPVHDAIVMAEVAEEATHVWSHQARIALFRSAMRHFAQWLRDREWPLHYLYEGEHSCASLSAAVETLVRQLQPLRLIVCKPGDWRVEQALLAMAAGSGLPLEIRVDRHFYTTPQEFAAWAQGRSELRLDYFYREQRRRHRVLMDGAKPLGGQWNYDSENRAAFGKQGPGRLPPMLAFPPDAVTRRVLDEVGQRYAGHPGRLDAFDWPVTPEDAEAALDDFIRHRLADFGRWQDAMWSAQDWLYHSRLSAAMNLKLISPRQVVDAVEQAHRRGEADIAAAEGFIRQILGWREYVRGLYWLRMPGYLDDNALDAQQGLPAFYWTGDTGMNCLRQCLGQTLRLGYAHHIQRLMVTGLFALMLGVRPRLVHEWYLAVYVDAVEWVELPNVIGMSQYADGGVMASKPYVASGKYIQRMSNYCSNCRFDPALATGAKACPFTTLYWDFLSRHQQRLSRNPRMQFQLRNLQRLQPDALAAIADQALRLRQQFDTTSTVVDEPAPLPDNDSTEECHVH
jgi:deoxyribodipyrimidine photolyase-related protein